ncbi:hypothetical protein [Prochlorococcus sp. MIT 0601]|uniref:hypothetical protein n=1 Tax=Prochlorococcus sp. MIT 0601 TaxID=1499498 RepID=UPI001267E50B|nr:hypothetical protein [Prochlorococcus sp. MIT 0601]
MPDFEALIRHQQQRPPTERLKVLEPLSKLEKKKTSPEIVNKAIMLGFFAGIVGSLISTPLFILSFEKGLINYEFLTSKILNLIAS